MGNSDRTGQARTDGFGSADWTGTAPVMGVAQRREVLTALKALDPNDRTVSADHVILPEDPDLREKAIERLRSKGIRIEGYVTRSDQLAVQTNRTPVMTRPRPTPLVEAIEELVDPDSGNLDPATLVAPKRGQIAVWTPEGVVWQDPPVDSEPEGGTITFTEHTPENHPDDSLDQYKLVGLPEPTEASEAPVEPSTTLSEAPGTEVPPGYEETMGFFMGIGDTPE